MPRTDPSTPNKPQTLLQRGVQGLLLLLALTLLTSCGSSTPTTVNIFYSSEKQAWLERLIAEYNQSQQQVYVQGYPTGSIASIAEIVEEFNTPTVWAPASSLSILLARDEWRRIHGVELYETTPQSLVRSPVVIAMWREMAVALGWPDKPIGWMTLSRLITSEQGWAAYGHPEWGAFTFGHTNPVHSNSGLASMLAIAYVTAGKQSSLTSADLTDPVLRAYMEEVLMSVSHYGSSTGFFAQDMFHCNHGGPAYLSAAILYENLVAEQERKRLEGNDCAAKHPPIVAIFPAEGTFWADHPYVILNAPWLTNDHKNAARAFQAYLLAEPQQRKAMALGYRPADPNIAHVSPLESRYGVDGSQPSTTLQSPSVGLIRELLKLWLTS